MHLSPAESTGSDHKTAFRSALAQGAIGSSAAGGEVAASLAGGRRGHTGGSATARGAGTPRGADATAAVSTARVGVSLGCIGGGVGCAGGLGGGVGSARLMVRARIRSRRCTFGISACDGQKDS